LPFAFSERLQAHPGNNGVLIIDGYEQLAVFSRLWTWRQQRRLRFGLLITAHRPVFRWPILYETVPNRKTYTRILQILLKNETARDLEGDSQVFDSLFTKHNGNMRQILLDLYDEWEEKTPHSPLSSSHF
jgi:hypothetical protein